VPTVITSLFVETRILPSGSDEHFTWRRYHHVQGDTLVAIWLRRPDRGRPTMFDVGAAAVGRGKFGVPRNLRSGV